MDFSSFPFTGGFFRKITTMSASSHKKAPAGPVTFNESIKLLVSFDFAQPLPSDESVRDNAPDE
ncbi:MAG: hypothetical protein P4L99_05965 [Chthoniobacter sp.]|nr:hypothetical protein [Chthoniobacter sp.]